MVNLMVMMNMIVVVVVATVTMMMWCEMEEDWMTKIMNQ